MVSTLKQTKIIVETIYKYNTTQKREGKKQNMLLYGKDLFLNKIKAVRFFVLKQVYFR